MTKINLNLKIPTNIFTIDFNESNIKLYEIFTYCVTKKIKLSKNELNELIKIHNKHKQKIKIESEESSEEEIEEKKEDFEQNSINHEQILTEYKPNQNKYYGGTDKKELNRIKNRDEKEINRVEKRDKNKFNGGGKTIKIEKINCYQNNFNYLNFFLLILIVIILIFILTSSFKKEKYTPTIETEPKIKINHEIKNNNDLFGNLELI